MKKAFIVLLLMVIIFVGFIYFLGGQEPVNYQAAANNKQGELIKKDAVDRDADNLADWEEEFWGSNPLNKDTDGDGADDGAEVLVGRSPIVAGPNDKVSNPTERLLAMARTASDSKNSPLISGGSAARIAPIIVESDLKIKESPTREFILLYGEQIQTAMRTYDELKGINEAKLTLEIIDQGKKENVEKIEEINNAHNQVIASLIKLEVPRGAEKIHLNLLNALIKLGEASFMMSLVEKEPALALGAVNKYGDNLQNFLSSINILNLYFTGQGFAFNKDKKLNLTFGL